MMSILYLECAFAVRIYRVHATFFTTTFEDFGTVLCNYKIGHSLHHIIASVMQNDSKRVLFTGKYFVEAKWLMNRY